MDLIVTFTTKVETWRSDNGPKTLYYCLNYNFRASANLM